MRRSCLFHVLVCASFLVFGGQAESNSAEIMDWQYQADDSDVMEHRLLSYTTEFIRKWITGGTDIESRVTLFELMELFLLPVKIFVKPIVRLLYRSYLLAA